MKNNKEMLAILNQSTTSTSNTLTIKEGDVAEYCTRCGLSSFRNKVKCVRCGHRIAIRTEYMSKQTRTDWDNIDTTNW